MNPKLGGVCQALRTMIKGLKKYTDVQNEVLSFDEPDASFIDEKLVLVHALGAGKGPWFYNSGYKSWLLQHLQRFDVVILHGLWNYQGYGLIKAIKQLQTTNASFSTKLFVMPHGMLDPYFQKAAGRKLKAIRNWVYWKLIENQVVNMASGLLFTCEAELQLAKQTFFPYLPKKELVVGLGVEEPPAFDLPMREAFLSKCAGLNQNPYLLFISRLHPKKGVDLLVNAYKDQINNANNNAVFIEYNLAKTKLVIAGPGLETPYGQQIKAAAAKLQEPEQQIFFPEMLTGDAKWGAFHGCEAFILPSHQENFGIAVVEALACGKPVLISNQINIYTEISNCNAGFVANDTFEGTKKLLIKWNGLSAKQKTEMGKNARKCYEKHFAVDPAAQKLLNAITAV
ncbi:MAG: glycosyltransferase [Janthinobacterium lividum]